MNLEIKNLDKYYNGVQILKDISLKAEAVSSVGIIGESGCGKSTLLRQLAGIEDPDCGIIEVDGVSPITEKSKFFDSIGYVFQQANLFPHLTIRKNLLLILEKAKHFKKEEASAIVDAVLKQLHIESIADKKPGKVSGGQAQRASIARALITDPKLLFLDEPTASLDPLLTDEVLQAVLSLKNDGRNFIFITHEMSFLKQFADYIIFMKDGVIHEAGEITHLSHPETPELATFLSKH